jgi:cytochrome c556
MCVVTRTRFLVALAMVATTLIADAADPSLKEIMQGLRIDSADVVDGLLRDDFEKVEAAALRIANHARIPPDQVQRVAAELGGEMPKFKQIDTLVHDLAVSIAAAARENDAGQAIEGYHRMLDACFACHVPYRDRVATVLSDGDEQQQ